MLILKNKGRFLVKLFVMLSFIFSPAYSQDFSLENGSPQVPFPIAAADIMETGGSTQRYFFWSIDPAWSAVDNIDAFSYGTDQLDIFPVNAIFSVDWVTAGVAGGRVDTEVTGNGALGDKFYVRLCSNPPVPAKLPALWYDAPTHSLMPAPTEDNIDGLSTIRSSST